MITLMTEGSFQSIFLDVLSFSQKALFVFPLHPLSWHPPSSLAIRALYSSFKLALARSDGFSNTYLSCSKLLRRLSYLGAHTLSLKMAFSPCLVIDTFPTALHVLLV
ncbi:hypothetical protein Tco_1200593 [Tanacetum coccineum]